MMYPERSSSLCVLGEAISIFGHLCKVDILIWKMEVGPG